MNRESKILVLILAVGLEVLPLISLGLPAWIVWSAVVLAVLLGLFWLQIE